MAKKKNKKEVIKESNNFDSSISGKVYAVVGILCFLAFFYLLTLYITTKNSSDSSSTEDNNANTEATISYEDIMVGKSFSMQDDDYLVLYFDKTDTDIASTYSSLVSTYKQKSGALNIYTVNMGNSFNSSYATEEDSNKTPGTVSDLKINGPTLIKISSKTAVEYIEGEEAISNYLQ